MVNETDTHSDSVSLTFGCTLVLYAVIYFQRVHLLIHRSNSVLYN